MTKILNKEIILSLIKEQWENRLVEAEKIDIFGKVDKEGEKNLLSPGLLVTHKKSGIKYSVDAVGGTSVVLITPEGEKFKVGNDDLEKEYEI